MKRRLAGILLLLLFSRSLWAGKKEDYKERSDIAEQWFFHELPRHVGNDLKETFWNRWHLLGIAAGTGLTLGIHQKDPEIQAEFHPRDVLGGANDLFNILGNGLVLGGGALVATTTFKLLEMPRATWTAGTMLEALTLTYAFTYPLKLMTQRERPDGSNSHSFPSAHASGSFALATVAESFYGPWIGIPSYLLATLISLSRLDSNKHVVSDVMAGALLGMVVGLGTARFHKEERKDFFVAPNLSASGGGIQIGRLF
ncbi:MAG: phosphatase PAP2 family protein [Deltaproteobacteria bacterium]|nr:phosphatase PAP2 family protein [Deltaproteobacteria bacterium]